MEGILVGCDCNQEWLLSWWWEHYSRHNTYPVAFVDFGMSEKASAWCREKGQHISLPPDRIVLKKLPSRRKALWEKRLGSGFWHARPAWFEKPFAFFRSPFAFSCWVDLDCEVKGALDPIFATLSLGAEIALVREPESTQKKDRKQKLIFPDEVSYNSGVVAFRNDAPVLQQWTEIASQQNDKFISDQNALSRAIYIHRPRLIELPPVYNWYKNQHPNPHAVIVHYFGSHKLEILENLHPSLFANQS
jgi:hypothetical protein